MDLWFALPETVRGAIVIFMAGAIGTMGAVLKNWLSYHAGLNIRNAERAEYFNKRLPELEDKLDKMQTRLDSEEERANKLQQRVIELETANALLRQEISQLREKIDYYKGIESERDKLRVQLDKKTARVNELSMELSSMQQRIIDCEDALLNKNDKQGEDHKTNES